MILLCFLTHKRKYIQFKEEEVLKTFKALASVESENYLHAFFLLKGIDFLDTYYTFLVKVILHDQTLCSYFICYISTNQFVLNAVNEFNLHLVGEISSTKKSK